MSRSPKITRTLSLFALPMLALLGGLLAAPSFASAQVADVQGLSLSTSARFEDQTSYGLFHLSAGRTYRVETYGLSADADTVLELRRATSPSGPLASDPVLAENDDGPGVGLASVVEWTADADGDYYAHVRAYDAHSGGSFSLRVHEVSGGGSTPPSQPGGIAPPAAGPPSGPSVMDRAGLSLSGGAFGAQPNLDLAQLAPGHTYRIETYGLSADADTVLEIRRGSAASASEGDAVVAENDDAPGAGLASRIEWTPDGSGPAYLHIRPYAPSTTGTFGLRITQVR